MGNDNERCFKFTNRLLVIALTPDITDSPCWRALIGLWYEIHSLKVLTFDIKAAWLLAN